MTSYRLFAFTRDDGPEARRERLPAVRVADAVTWAVGRGFEKVLVELDDADPFNPNCVHHLCADPDCPGGC